MNRMCVETDRLSLAIIVVHERGLHVLQRRGVVDLVCTVGSISD